MAVARNSSLRYGWVAQTLHWGMFALIVLQLAGGTVLEDLPKQSPLRSFAFDAHETLGLIMLFLVFARLSWTMVNPIPLGTGPAWQRTVARATHAVLYLLMLAIPVIGYAMVDAKGYDVAFFGWAAPDLLATDKALADRLRDVHGTLAKLLALLIAVHFGAALWHHFVHRDSVLQRMLPRREAATSPNH